MATWSSRGLRGSHLEDLINLANERYRHQGLGLIQKIPTPITPINIEKDTRHITLAYFDQKSTVDYIGVIQSVPVCFDAKECRTDRFPLQNVHQHQMDFMADFEKQGGVAFLLIFYAEREEFYYLPFRRLINYWHRKEQGGRKSMTFDEVVRDSYQVSAGQSGVQLHYLPALQEDLDDRDQEDLDGK